MTSANLWDRLGPMFRPQPISSTEARKYFSQILNKVQFSSKSFVIKSYRKPVVRLVKEEYIAILEQVLGKQTVGQIMQISSNDSLREAQKAQEIRRILQRRLSGGPRPQPPVQRKQKSATSAQVPIRQPAVKAPTRVPAPQQVKAPHPVPPASNPKTPKPQPQPQPKPNNPQKDRGPLLLQNGKNY